MGKEIGLWVLEHKFVLSRCTKSSTQRAAAQPELKHNTYLFEDMELSFHHPSIKVCMHRL